MSLNSILDKVGPLQHLIPEYKILTENHFKKDLGSLFALAGTSHSVGDIQKHPIHI